MARIIAITNQKGGTGKTTTSINLAAYLASIGKYVLLLDLDSQFNATSGIGVKQESIDQNVYHSLMGYVPLEEIIKKSNIFGLDIAPSTPDLAGATIELISQEEREFALRRALGNIRTDYDYIIIDCPPSLGILTINALVAADEVLIPVQCEYYALEGLSQLLETINLVKENLKSDLEILGALLTMYDPRNRLAHEVVKDVRRNFPGRVFDAVVYRNVSLAEAPSFGKSILQYNPGSKGAQAYLQLAREIIALEKKVEAFNFTI